MQTGVIETLDEKAFFITINQVATLSFQTYGMTVTYYHKERPHCGLDRKMIDPLPQDEDGEIVEFERLGGLLKSYRRVKKAA